MQKPIVLIILAYIISFQGYNLIAQKVNVETKSIEDIDGKIVIKYDLVDSKASQHFNVSLAITNSTGQIIHANSLTGDLGNKISGGSDKEIIWNYTEDEFVMKGNLNIEVIALLSNSNANITKSMLLSTVWPGWGLSKMEKKKSFLMLGVAGYGCLGASLLLKKKSNDNYDAYVNNTDDKLNDDLFNKSLSQNKLSKTMAFTALGVWGTSLVWTLMRARRNNKISVGQLDQKQLLFYTEFDPLTKTKGFVLRYRF